MTRDPAAARFPAGVQVVHGDLAEPGILTAGLAGADRLHLFPYPATAREVVDLARRAGVRRVTVLSSGSVTAGFDTDYQLPVEQAVEASGLEWTHLRPGEFAANRLALWGPSVRSEGGPLALPGRGRRPCRCASRSRPSRPPSAPTSGSRR